MNKEPIGLYIFHFVVGICIVAFMALIYWSVVLIEEHLQDVKLQLRVVQQDLATSRSEMRKLNKSLVTASFQSLGNGDPYVNGHRYADAKHPNLLIEDPFYETTLPNILGPSFRPEGEIRSTEVGKPEHFHPFSNWAPATAAKQLCVASVATLLFGKYEDFAPDLAVKMELREDGEKGPEYWIHLRDDVYWQPLNPKHFPASFELDDHFFKKHPVTAYDFKFQYDAIMNPYVQEAGAAAMRNYYRDIEEFRVVDEKTFVVRWKAKEFVLPSGVVEHKIKYASRQLTGGLLPLPEWVYKYFADGTKILEEDADSETYRHNSIWAQNFSNHWAKNVIIGCGTWMFDGVSDQEVRFKRNPDYHNPLAALVERKVIEFTPTPDGAWQSFKAMQSDDFGTRGAASKLVELEDFLKTRTYQEQAAKGASIKKIDYLDRSYAWIGWNQKNPLFESNIVRRALTMAIDRRRIITQILNGQGIETTGPFFPNSPAYDGLIDAWPYDPVEARQLLSQQGWEDHNGDGVLDKVIDGKSVRFTFTLIYYYGAAQTRALADYVATALQEIGVECKPLGMDVADLSAAFEGKEFDALFLAWVMGIPPDDPRQIWHSSGAEQKGSSNLIGFKNGDADALIDALQYEDDTEKRLQLYHKFHRIIHDEAPYTFLYTPRLSLLYREYIKNVFIPKERQDLVPGATVTEPVSSVFYVEGRPGS